MSEKKRGLGRGLSALIGDSAVQPPTATPSDAAEIAPTVNEAGGAPESGADGGPLRYLGLDQLRPGRLQPRKNFAADELAALAASVKKSGVLQPLLVRPIDGSGAAGRFEIIAGERRWRAAQAAGLHQVPVIVQKVNDVTALEIGLIENIQRTDLNPIEEAEGYAQLVHEFGYTQAQLAETIGKSRSHIANLLRFTDAAPAVRAALIARSISMSHARALLGVGAPDALVKKIIAEGLSVRAVETLVAQNDAAAAPAQPAGGRTAATAKTADTRALEKTVSDATGLKVSIDDRGADKGGAVRISYTSLAQLDGLVARLLGR